MAEGDARGGTPARLARGLARRARRTGTDAVGAVGATVARTRNRRGLATLVEAAERAGWPVDASQSAFLEAVHGSLARHSSPAIAILSRRPTSALTEIVATHDSRPRVVVCATSGTAGQLHADLAACGRYAVIIDDTRQAPERAQLFRSAFWHLEPGGAYVVRGGAVGAKRLRRQGRESLTALLRRVQRLAAEPPDEAEPRHTTDERRLGQAVVGVTRHGRHLVVRTRATAWAKLKERQANAWLEARGPGAGSFLERHPRQDFESRCELSESPSFRAGEMPTSYRVPAITSREYLGSLCLPGQIVLHDNVVMPDTYRHNQRQRLANRFLEELGPLFAAPAGRTPRPARLEGSYFHLDSEFRGHFGHALTEQLSRLWGWQEAKAADPDLKALLAVNAGRRTLAQFERDLFAAAGIAESDLTLVDRPVTVGRLVSGTPMFANPAYVHPRIVDTWGEVGDALVASAPDRDYPRRIFCSRRADPAGAAFGPNRRVCRNADEVEALFEAHGFTVVHTEDHPLAEQARLFREAEVVAGYAGSAMFNLVFAGSPKQVVLLSSESYTAKNEHLISSALGHRLAIAWCQAEIPQVGRWDRDAFNSAYRFDLDREGRFVTRVLEDL